MKDLRLGLFLIAIVFALFGGTALVSAATATTTISSVISPVLSVFTTSGTVNVNVTPTGAGAQTINNDTVTISTNDSSGYTLQLAETTAVSNLVSGGNTIPPSAGTQAVPVVMANNTWGYAVQSIGGFNSSGYATATSAAVSGTLKFAAVPATASPNTIKTTAGVASNDTTSVWYAVAATTAQASGTYTNSVTYTATTN